MMKVPKKVDCLSVMSNDRDFLGVNERFKTEIRMATEVFGTTTDQFSRYGLQGKSKQTKNLLSIQTTLKYCRSNQFYPVKTGLSYRVTFSGIVTKKHAF